MRVAAVLLLVRGATAANGTRVRGHGFSFDATAVLERRALPVNGSWRVRQHARARCCPCGARGDGAVCR